MCPLRTRTSPVHLLRSALGARPPLSGDKKKPAARQSGQPDSEIAEKRSGKLISLYRREHFETIVVRTSESFLIFA